MTDDDFFAAVKREQELWSKGIAASLMMMKREQDQRRSLVNANWDDESRDRQNRLLLELAICLALIFLTWLIFG